MTDAIVLRCCVKDSASPVFTKTVQDGMSLQSLQHRMPMTKVYSSNTCPMTLSNSLVKYSIKVL